MAKNNEIEKGGPDRDENKVDLHLPPKLFDRAKALYDLDKELFSHVVSAVFTRNELFGISKLRLVKGVTRSKDAKAAKSPKKDCDVDPKP